MLKIIAARKVFYTISLVLLVISALVLVVEKVPYGLDFTGGSLFELSYAQPGITSANIADTLVKLEIAGSQVQTLDETGFLVRLPEISEEQRKAVISALQEQAGPDNTVTQNRFESVGPVIGSELKSTSIKAIIIALLAILFYIAWAFRKVSWPVASWKYGTVAIIALFHNIFVTFSAFIFLAHQFAWEINTAFVAAILTILGFTVNDTIVVFDRIRENVQKMSGTFEEIVNASVNQTMARSINTSLTALLVLFAILFTGGVTLKPFVTTLIIGILVGAYTSIFIASPLLVTWQKLSKK